MLCKSYAKKMLLKNTLLMNIIVINVLRLIFMIFSIKYFLIAIFYNLPRIDNEKFSPSAIRTTS